MAEDSIHSSPLVTEIEIASAVAVLRRLQPADLKGHHELIQEGTRLFERTIKTKLFGEDSVVAFLKQQGEYRFLLKRLEKVQEEVERNHSTLIQQASSAAINTMRETKTSEVNVIGVTALSTQAGLLTLLESLSVNPQLYQDYQLLESSQTQPLVSEEVQHDGVKESEVNESTPPSIATGSNKKKKSKTTNNHSSSASAVATTVATDNTSVDHYSNGSAFRAGGIGRSRGRRAAFNLNRIEGMYDDCVVEDEGDDGLEGTTREGSRKLRRKGTIYFVPRSQASTAADGSSSSLPKLSSTSTSGDGNGSGASAGVSSIGSSVNGNQEPLMIPGLGMLSYVHDDEDGALRAVALRTIVDISGALTNLVGVTVQDDGSGTVFSHPVTYVIGHRRQRWALLGGEIQGLNGETAISVRLYLSEGEGETVVTPPAVPTDTEGDKGNDTSNVGGQSTIATAAATPSLSMPDVIRGYVVPPRGSFRHHCNVCKQPYTQMHSFYHQLCPRCGDFNLQKRMQTADLSGYVCVVTGGRVRIGYQICLKLLRAGATVIATSRWPHDTVLRFAQESDFFRWQSRLSVDELELSDIDGVERYCTYLIGRYPRLHVLINNAAQTLTRPPGWRGRMDKVDAQALSALQSQRDIDIDGLQRVLLSPWNQTQILGRQLLDTSSNPHLHPNPGQAGEVEGEVLTAMPEADPVMSVAKPVVSGETGTGIIGSLDESGQPLDKSGMNSWSRRLAQVSTAEMVQTMAVNAVAPFVLCSRLQPVLAPSVLPAAGTKSKANDQVYSHIVNVTALEGKFNVGKKSGGHPHTNMAKAALNMMTLTGARDYARTGILMNSVDTGWVTDMAPGGVGASSAMHETFIGPPLDDEDGASRVLDPVFSHVLGHGSETHCGHFYKDYLRASW